MSRILRPYVDASVLTAYFAQLNCSMPRKPAPPVSGVTTAILSVLLQLTACVRVTADEPAPAVDASAAATTTVSASTISPRFFIPIALLGWLPPTSTPRLRNLLHACQRSARLRA